MLHSLAKIEAHDDHDGERCDATLTVFLPIASARVRARDLSAIPLTRSITACRDHRQRVSGPRAALQMEYPASVPVDMDPFHRAFVFSKAVVSAIEQYTVGEDLKVVQWLVSSYCPIGLPFAPMSEAAHLGKVHIMEWIATNHANMMWIDHYVAQAASGGHLEALQWLQANSYYKCPTHAISAVVEKSHFAVLNWLVDQSSDVLMDGFGAAISKGRMEMAQYLYDRCCKELRGGFSAADPRCRLGVHLASRFAMTEDRLDVLQWLYTKKIEGLYSSSMSSAVTQGRLQICQWLHESFPLIECSREAMDSAAASGHLEIVQWLHANRTEGCTSGAMDGAATKGFLEVVQWLHANRTEGCTTRAMDGAAAHGHLDIVRWLHENRTEGCSARAMDLAAAGGHLEVLKWLHENRSEGCTTDAMDCGAAGGHLEVLKWLHEHRHEGCTTEAMDSASKNNRIEVVKWLHANRREGCTVDAINNAGSLELLKWLHEHRTEGSTSAAMDDALENNNFERLQYLISIGSPVCTVRGAVRVVHHDRLEMFMWLHAHHPALINANDIRQGFIGKHRTIAMLDRMGL